VSHAPEIIALGHGQRRLVAFFQQQLTVAEDRVDRRSEIVTHVSDEGGDITHDASRLHVQQRVDLDESSGEIDEPR
jgi:hypothetical protein